MGDMADYVNEMIEEAYEARYAWRSGNLTHEEAYDRGVVDEWGAEYGTTSTKTCRCCGEEGLLWGQQPNGKWRLMSPAGGLHQCPVNPLTD